MTWGLAARAADTNPVYVVMRCQHCGRYRQHAWSHSRAAYVARCKDYPELESVCRENTK